MDLTNWVCLHCGETFTPEDPTPVTECPDCASRVVGPVVTITEAAA